jgi:2-polyprenyl-6-hydroxyphenyl methylase/3-demethylubiquinone-9 3-methyltransferase
MADRTALTDRSDALAADEYVWEGDGDAEAHRYLAAPVLARLRGARAQSVLDLGCGNGAFGALLAREGYEVTGLDPSASGIEIARARGGGSFMQYDLNEPLPARHAGRYDAVVALEVIEHLLLPRRLMERALAALRPGGLLVLSTPYHGYLKNLALALAGAFDAHWHPLRDYGHVKFFSRRTLGALFEEYGLEELEFATAGRVPPLAKSMIVSGHKPR